jgi:DNA-binding NtrC family response regulator
MPIKVLIAEDEKNLRKVLKTELSIEGYEISESDDGQKTVDLLQKESFDILLLDLNMPVLGGLDVQKKIRDLEISTEVIILTGNMTIATAVMAMKLGAYDYLTKPFDLDELFLVMERAYEQKKLRRENLLLKTQIRHQTEKKQIVTNSPLMYGLLETACKVADSEFPVLILGESGVGKELFACAIHDCSARSDGPFIPINCGAIPETMIETELFGHEKGAFTGAHSRKTGLIEVANKGTVFLDEIAELPLQLQVKLLRVIETKSFFRVGGVNEIRVDVKFLAASNKDVKAETEKGNFRPDLYYRMSALTLHIPPLRERKEDIPLLIEHFIRNSPAYKNRKIGKDAMDILSEYPWPGNVREMQNVIHRTLLLSRNEIIGREDLPSDLFGSCRKSGARLEDVEREYILKVLGEAGGQKAKAAEVLGIDPKTLYRKLAQFEKK